MRRKEEKRKEGEKEEVFKVTELINSCNKGIQLDRSRYVGISSLRPFHLHSLFHLPFLIATFCYATSRNMLTQDSL